ncbi:MAG: hypothetical protein AAF587_35295 [Bacteroidota bacterium]
MIKLPFVTAFLLSLLGGSLPSSLSLEDERPVNDIIFNVPQELANDTLLIPRYDFLDPEDGAVGARREFVVNVNKQAKKGNTTINEIALKSYPYPYKLISLSEVAWYRDNGYKYFMDMALMPKQMRQPEPKALIPAFEKFSTANKMFRNRNSMWHFYFYIRDLSTDDAYMTSKLKGSFEVYRCMKSFLGRVSGDLGSPTGVAGKLNAVKNKIR